MLQFMEASVLLSFLASITAGLASAYLYKPQPLVLWLLTRILNLLMCKCIRAAGQLRFARMPGAHIFLYGLCKCRDLGV